MRYTLVATLAALVAVPAVVIPGTTRPHPTGPSTPRPSRPAAARCSASATSTPSRPRTRTPASIATTGARTSAGPTWPTRSTRATSAPRSLDGAKFWVATDLGGDFSKGELDWGVLYFDKSLTQAQRDAIGVVAGRIFPVKWRSFRPRRRPSTSGRSRRRARSRCWTAARRRRCRLKKFQGMTDEPVVIRNLRYWGAPRNDGFILMPNEVEAYRVGPKAFEFKGTNGFLITIDLTSNDFAS